MSSESFSPAGARNQTDVYAVHGADPEVLAYAMAKYSRSSLSMRESLTEISAQRAEQFLNTFYFQYGHRSIADLAHIAFAVERLSLLAAIVLVDEQRWDGQERSTRYQNFQKSGWYFPDFGSDAASANLYSDTVENLFSTYQRTTAAVHEALRQRVICPEEMKPEAYDRTLKARAFDVARYLLPLATNTSLGQIVNARTLETQVSRLLSHPIAEVRDLGAKLREAATGPAWNVNSRAGEAFVAKLGDPELAAEAANLLTREVRTAPTLVKYAEPNHYLIQTRAELEQAAAELLDGIPSIRPTQCDLVERTESLEVELAATLIYWASHHPYRQVRDIVAELPAARVAEIIELGLRHRGRHDEALRAFHAGAALRFDILMDIGGFRDMHRHRRVTQIQQGFTPSTATKHPTPATPPDSKKPASSPTISPPSNPPTPPAPKSPPAPRPKPRVCSLPAAAGHARSLPLQNGLRRSAIHQRTPLRPRRPLQLSPRRLGDVSGPRAPAPVAGQIHPRHRLHPADRPAATVECGAGSQKLASAQDLDADSNVLFYRTEDFIFDSVRLDEIFERSEFIDRTNEIIEKDDVPGFEIGSQGCQNEEC